MFIKPALIDRAKAQPMSWQDIAFGRWLSRQEKLAFDPFWSRMAGDYALTLGPLSEAVATACKATEVISVHAGDSARVRADLMALPFAKRSVDMCVMAHVLEYARDPHQVLREADRCLAFDGYLVISAFNPLALANLTGLWPSHFGRAPWNCRLLTRQRVADWLSLLNYEVLTQGYVSEHALWFGDESAIEQRSNPLCHHVPWLRGSYFMIARKRVYPLTPNPSFLRFAQPMHSAQPVQARWNNPVDKY